LVAYKRNLKKYDAGKRLLKVRFCATCLSFKDSADPEKSKPFLSFEYSNIFCIEISMSQIRVL